MDGLDPKSAYEEAVKAGWDAYNRSHKSSEELFHFDRFLSGELTYNSHGQIKVMMNKIHLLAHSPSDNGKRQDTVANHLNEVANWAEKFADSLGMEQEAKLAGLLHDLGKYGDLFQRRLRGEVRGVDHWSAGAWAALHKAHAIPAAMAIQGHHIGMQRANKSDLLKLNPSLSVEKDQIAPVPRHAETDMTKLYGLLAADGIELPSPAQLTGFDNPISNNHRLARMVDNRMLFSCLVDADFVATEAHFNADEEGRAVYRQPGPILDPKRDLDKLLELLDELARENSAAKPIKKLRSDLLQACIKGGEQPPGLFTLTAPTGAGKTLSMLAFALRHAAGNKLRRIVMVIPYLSIIDQTVEVYRGFYRRFMGDTAARSYVLENHSLAGTKMSRDDSPDHHPGYNADPRLQAENWDAPIVVTTSVQFLESLFANRPAACRKLHRLADSVILFDEVQTLPLNLVGSVLASLRRLHDRFGVSIVFSTATQPAFESLSRSVADRVGGPWNPNELAAPTLNLFNQARRVICHWPGRDERTAWPDLAEKLADLDQTLCIVNLKRHALELLKIMEENGVEDLYHLSTSMCPAHREQTLREIHRRIKEKQTCRLVATQCVEAGVDLDFPCVYRTFGPLDAVAQAAGRCNRNGRLDQGQVFVFHPPDDGRGKYPTGAYRQAAQMAASLLEERGDLNINDPSVFRAYYRKLYNLAQVEDQDQELRQAIEQMDFALLAQRFRVINTDAVNVLVPYHWPTFTRLRDWVLADGLSKAWLMEARPHTIGLYRPGKNNPAGRWLEPIPDRRGRPLDDWFIYAAEDHYHPRMGLVPQMHWDELII